MENGFYIFNNSGDHDFQVPFLGTQAWIRSLNYSIVDDWRPWHTNEQVAGYSHNCHYDHIELYIYDTFINYDHIELIFVLNFCMYRYTRTYSNGMTFATVKVSLLFLNRNGLFIHKYLYDKCLCYKHFINLLNQTGHNHALRIITSLFNHCF
jgi:hypothetical protein